MLAKACSVLLYKQRQPSASGARTTLCATRSWLRRSNRCLVSLLRALGLGRQLVSLKGASLI